MKKRIYILLAVVVSFLCISFASAATVPWDRTKVGTQVPLYGDGILVTASSTFLGNITAASLPTGCLTSVAGLFTSVGCSTIGSAFPFTPTTNYNVAVNSTSTPIWFTGGLMASSTARLTYASTTALTVAGNAYFPGSGIWNSSGVGIGTTTLDIAGTGLDTLVIGTASAINAGIVLDLGAAGTGAYGFAINGTINGRISYSAASKAMSFLANSLTAQMTIDSSGNVGIGATDPINKLTISATTSTDITNGQQINLRSLRTGIIANSLIGGITFTSNDTNLTAPGLVVSGVTSLANETHTGATQGTDLVFATTATGGTATNTEKMRITGAGSVGIGTSSPWGKLSVTGAGTGTGVTFTAANSSNSPLFTVLDNGTVGVGTGITYTSSIYGMLISRSLDASTTPNFTSMPAGSAQGEISDMAMYSTFVGTGDSGPRRTADIVAGFNGGAWGNEYLAFGVGFNGVANDGRRRTTEKMRITGAGNVGIGSSTPFAKLSLHAYNGETNTTLFAVGSSTASATTTLFSISNIGNTVVSAIMTAARVVISGIAAAFTPSVEGEIGIDTTSNQFKFFSGGAVRVIAPDVDQAFLFASSTLGAGTTTLKVSGYYRGSTFARFGCTSSGGGTFVAQLGDSTSSSTAVVSGTNNTTTFTALSLNNTFTSGEAVYYAIGSVSGTVTNPSCSFNRTITAD